jgi:hypothetical protein
MYTKITELNAKYYNGKLLTLAEFEVKVQEYKELMADKQAKKIDLINDIPALWTLPELLGTDYEKIYKPVLEKTPWWLTYIYIYPTPIIYPPFKIGGFEFYNPIMYIGKGTPMRVCSHATPNTKEKSLTDTALKEIILDLRKVGQEPYLFIAARGLDETRSKWVEADLIKCYKAKSHYTRGEVGLQLAPSYLNQRRETSNEGFIFTREGEFINSPSNVKESLPVNPDKYPPMGTHKIVIPVDKAVGITTEIPKGTFKSMTITKDTTKFILDPNK